MGTVDGACQLSQSLRHQTGVQSHVAVSHLALNLRLRNQRGHGIDDDDVDGSAADQHLTDLQPLLAGIRLRDQEFIHVDAEIFRILRVQSVLRIDKRCSPAGLLRLGDNMEGQRRLSRGLRTVDLRDPPLRNPKDARGDIEADRSGGNRLHIESAALSQLHDGALAVLLLNLLKRRLQRFIPVDRSLCSVNRLVRRSHI